MTAEKRTCATCAHGIGVAHALGRAVECREGPPAVVPTPQGLATMFPQLQADAWCRRWEPKPVKLAAVEPVKNGGKSDGDA